jgi:hypothetical protein
LQCSNKQQEKANLIKEVLLGNPRVEELIATQIMRGQILSQRFWEPKAAYYGSDEEDEDEDVSFEVFERLACCEPVRGRSLSSIRGSSIHLITSLC